MLVGARRGGGAAVSFGRQAREREGEGEQSARAHVCKRGEEPTHAPQCLVFVGVVVFFASPPVCCEYSLSLPPSFLPSFSAERVRIDDDDGVSFFFNRFSSRQKRAKGGYE
eukprot:TRINITY_DN3022_c0_g3_i1.p2 TRINITY_DN3022_c0_g3~~TRINITY_DN3022_c0_g3_i1.p2  ORF type:complete len:111 (-),score=0.56 TRINITY_DN3022_c0_g3_i1:40-372(-)